MGWLGINPQFTSFLCFLINTLCTCMSYASTAFSQDMFVVRSVSLPRNLMTAMQTHPTAFYIRVFLGFLVEFVGDMPPISIGTPMGPSGTTCGYCGSLGERSATESSFKKAGLIASQLSCGVRPPYTFVSTGVRYTSRYTRR